MPRAIFAALLVCTMALPAFAQEPKKANAAPRPLTATQQETQRDHKLMMEALGIKSLRQGANGKNRNAPNAANYDESKVKSFTLPDPLVCKDGTKVTSPEQWWSKRRPEIVEDFDREVYGRVPKDVPEGNVGGDEHDEREDRRHPGDHQAARGARRQHEVPGDQGRYSAHADDAGRGQGAGAGDDGVWLRRLRLPSGRRTGQGRHQESRRRSADEGDDERRRVSAASGAAAGRRGSSRCSPRAGVMPSSCRTASRPTTARG